jgi:hypothetical protein
MLAVKRLILLGIMPARIVLFGLSGIVASTDIPNNGITNAQAILR